MSYLPTQLLRVGIPASGGAANGILFEDASQNLAQDAGSFSYDSVLKRAGLGGARGAGALALYQDPTSGFVSTWSGAGSSIGWTIREVQPSNSGGTFLVNMAGSTAGMQLIQNNNPTAVGFNLLALEGNVAN